MIGQTLSHYKILEKLGEGGMGVVYKAHDTELDRMVALKFLPSFLTSDTTEKERFYHEARAASALNHPNITTIYEIKDHQGQLYLAMEYVEGKTLKKLIDQDPPSVKKALDCAIQVCDGLAAAHEKGVVHRDIKSDNIMLTPKSQIKIMDFGLAKVKGATKLTKAGSTLGTAAYMSPEQAQGEEVDHRTDIFSFGVVLYELLATKLPFRGEHQAALMYSLINEDPQPLARFNDKVSPELERIVFKALAKDRDERYQHIDDMLADLRKERKSLEYASAGYVRSMASMPAIEAVKPSIAKKKYMGYLIAGGVIVALLLAFVIFNPFNFQVTTQKSAAAAGQQSLAVMYFQNIADPGDKEHMGDMLSDLLITALSQSKGVEVISRERLFDIQTQLQADSKSITPEMATKVAQRAGVTTMLLGSILQKQPTVAVTYRLVDVQSGNILGSQRITGYPMDKVFALVDTMALLIKGSFSVAADQVSETKSVAEVTTKSPEAYRSYIEGIDLNTKFYMQEAKAAFRRAIELDSTFAMAYYRLATLNNGDIPADEGKSLIEKAWQLRGNVNERERLELEAAYVGFTTNDLRKSVQLGEAILEKYPREQRIYQGLCVQYTYLGKYDDALRTIRRSMQVDSLDKTSWNLLAYCSIYVGRKDEALAAIDRYIQLAPAEPNPYDSKGDIYYSFGDLENAEIWWRKALSFRPDFPSSQKLAGLDITTQRYDEGETMIKQYATGQGQMQEIWPQLYAIAVSAHKGQLNRALKQFEVLQAAVAQRKLTNFFADGALLRAMICYELGNYAGMLDVARHRTTVGSHQPGDLYGRDVLAFALIKNGKKDEAAQVIRSIQQDFPNPLPSQNSAIDYYDALVAYDEGKFDVAIEHFKKSLENQALIHAPQYFYAVSLLKTGHLPEAIAELQRGTWWLTVGNGNVDLDFASVAGHYVSISTAKAHYWLGVAYEQQGNRDLAVQSYQKFLDIWKDADFPSKEITDAKARLAKLKAKA